jgi:hypothetical protein
MTVFADRGPDGSGEPVPSAGTPAPDPSGPHLPDDTHAVADLGVLRIESVGDHQVVFGRVNS